MTRTFVAIERENSYGEKTALVLSLDTIIAIKGIHREPDRLYDENRKLVSETPKPNQYMVIVDNCEEFYIDQTNYDILTKALIK